MDLNAISKDTLSKILLDNSVAGLKALILDRPMAAVVNQFLTHSDLLLYEYYLTLNIEDLAGLPSHPESSPSKHSSDATVQPPQLVNSLLGFLNLRPKNSQPDILVSETTKQTTSKATGALPPELNNIQNFSTFCRHTISAVVLIQPTAQNISMLAHELAANAKFVTYHLYFPNTVIQRFVEILAEADCEAALAASHSKLSSRFTHQQYPLNAPDSLVAGLYEGHLDFLAIEKYTFNTTTHMDAKNSIISSSTNPLSRNAALKEATKKTAASIYSLHCALTGALTGALSSAYVSNNNISVTQSPQIRYQVGSFLAKKIADELAGYYASLLVASAPANSAAQNDCLILVLDRSFDYFTPLMTKWNYVSLIHENFGFTDPNCSQVKMPLRTPETLADIPDPFTDHYHPTKSSSSTLTTSSSLFNKTTEYGTVLFDKKSDFFLRDNYQSHYGSACKRLQTLLNSHKNHIQHSKMTFGASGSNSQFDASRSASSAGKGAETQLESLEQMRNFIRSYPKLMDSGQVLNKHLNIISQVSVKIQAGQLLEVSELEQDMMVYGTTKSAIAPRSISQAEEFFYQKVADHLVNPVVKQTECIRLLLIFFVKFGASGLYQASTISHFEKLLALFIEKKSPSDATVQVLRSFPMYYANNSRVFLNLQNASASTVSSQPSLGTQSSGTAGQDHGALSSGGYALLPPPRENGLRANLLQLSNRIQKIDINNISGLFSNKASQSDADLDLSLLNLASSASDGDQDADTAAGSVFMQYTPKIAQVLKHVCTGTLSHTDFPFLSHANSVGDPSPTTTIPSQEPASVPSNVIIFVNGGASFEEALIIDRFNETSRSSRVKRALLGSSCMHNLKSYLDYVAWLPKDSLDYA